MSRCFATAFVALIILTGGVTQGGGKAVNDFKAEGKITKDDPRDKVRNTHCKIHVVQLKKGTRYTMDMIGMGFDAYLRLEDPKGKELAQDDDSGGNLNARIEFDCQQDGKYRVICTTYNEQGMGAYTLLVKAAGAAATNVSTHEVLIGKPAPDFECDFAVNGKPCKLSDLKGKVVLAEFMALGSEPCAATFAKLRAWHKEHSEAGLQVVGVTYYGSEVGQMLAFDKDAGRITRVEKASRQSDRETLRDFARHHKLEFLLMALPKDAALKAFDAYAVNGVPQLVLIDRSGLVQTVGVGERESTLSAVEADLKKLLAK